jgi:hypothetical protein
MWVDKNYAMVNGKKVKLDVPPKSIKGKVMVPVKFVTEQLGASMVWDLL